MIRAEVADVTPLLDDAGKVSKKEAHYGAGGRDHCGICRFYVVVHPQMKVGGCTKVRGPIRPEDWCKFYQLADGQKTVRSDTFPPKAVSRLADIPIPMPARMGQGEADEDGDR
jgi:hypothetical protein